MPAEPLPLTGRDGTGRQTGIDVGLTVFLVTADDEQVANPRYYHTAEQQLAKAHQRVSRRTTRSKRWWKAVRHCAKQQQQQGKQQQVRRPQRVVHHKTALSPLRQYDTIDLDDVQVRTLVRDHHLAKRISDAGLGRVSHRPRKHSSRR